MLENVSTRANEIMRTLFEPEFSLGGFRIGFAREPITDKAAGYRMNGEDEDISYKDELMPTYKNMRDGKKAFREYVRSTGLPIRKVSHDYLMRRFGGDFIGYRTGDEIFSAGDRFGEPLTDAQKDAVIAHEIGSDHDHENSDPEAQRNAIELLKSFNYKDATEEAIRMQKNAGWN